MATPAALARILLRYSDIRNIENIISVITSYNAYVIATHRLGSNLSMATKISLTMYTGCVYWGLFRNRKYCDICKITLKYLFIVVHM
jgi:hypothetical protein